jgi:hypothetical protein
MDVQVMGRVFSTPAAVTALLNGAEVHSGQVGQGMPLDTEIELISFGWADAEPGDTASLSLTVTSGVITVGSCFGNEIWQDMRRNILINGQPPEDPGSHVGHTPAEHWSGWFFEISAGETLTCTLQAHEPQPDPKP